MSVAVQLVVNGLIAGAMYALIASGFSLVYSVMKFIHFVHGALVMIGAFAMFTFYAVLGAPFPVAILGAITVAVVVCLAVDRVVYRRLRLHGTEFGLLLGSFAAFVLFQSSILLLFGAEPRTLVASDVASGVEIFGALVTPVQLSIIATAVVLLAVLHLFLKRTHAGMALRAVAQDADVSTVVGIRVERVHLLTLVISSVLAGAAGVLVSLEQNMEPNMGMSLILKGITAAIIGGITSVQGAMLGGFVIGIVENLGIWYLPSLWKDAIAFGVLFVFLVFRPQGLFGVPPVVRS